MEGADIVLLLQLTRQFGREWSGDGSAFYEYLAAVRRLVDEQRVDVRAGADAIASTMFLDGLDDDPLREEILIVSGDLETGQPHPKHSWAYLTELIDAFGRSTSPDRGDEAPPARSQRVR